MKKQIKNALIDIGASNLDGVPIEDLLFDDYPYSDRQYKAAFPISAVSAWFLPNQADGRPPSPSPKHQPPKGDGEDVPDYSCYPVFVDACVDDGGGRFWQDLKAVAGMVVGVVSVLLTAVVVALMFWVVSL